MKIVKKIVFGLVILAVIIILFFVIKRIYNNWIKQNLKSKTWISEHVALSKSEYGNAIYTISKNKNISIFNSLYQEVVNEKINEMNNKKNTFKTPLIIYNPYGTNKLSFNIYFNTDEESKLVYKISVDGYVDFSSELNNEKENNLTKEHSYQLIGFIPGKINHLSLVLKNKNDDIIDEQTIDIDMTSIKINVSTQLEVFGEGKLSNGLFAMLGHDNNYNANTYLYDNNGILRSELVLDSYRSDRIIFDGTDMIYSYSKSGFIRVNRTGMITQKYDIDGYTMHHDYVYDDNSNKLVILANKNGADTIEDRVISLDLDTGKVKELLNMMDYLEEMYDKAISPGKNTYGGYELDWIHLNSLQVVNSKDIILSSRELSSIIYIENFYTNPQLKYIIADSEFYDDTIYQSYLLQSDGEFNKNVGQHSIVYSKGDDGKYYIELFNNYFGKSRTRPDFKFNNFDNIGTYEEGEYSYYQKYEVDEETNSYKIVNEIKIPYSSIVSGVISLDDNIITSSGMSHCIDEYDSDNNLLKEFKYTSKKYAYRVYKYSFDNWFKL